MPTSEAVPNLPVAQVVSKSVKKTAKSQSIGSLNQTKPKGPKVKFRITHRAEKIPTNVISMVVRCVLRFI